MQSTNYRPQVLSFQPAVVPNVVHLRRAMGVTQQSLADRVGVDRLTVRRWEAGTRPIPHHHRAQLIEMFGCSERHLLGTDF